MTFLCISTFLSLVFQQDAQSLLGEKRTEYLFCSTSEKWSPEPLTSTPLETELNVTKESLTSWGKLNRGCTFDSCHSNFQGFFSPQLHLTVCTLLSSPQVNATHCCGTNRLGEESSQILKECQSCQSQDWGKDTLDLLLPCSSGHRCWLLYKIPFPLSHKEFRFS